MRAMKFVSDGMLGKLTRWLRLAGQDVICINDYSVDPCKEDEVLINRAKEGPRVLITRDKELNRRALREGVKSILVVETDDVAKQMKTVSDSVGESIDVDIENSRCPVCNGKLESIVKSSVSSEVPDRVLKNNERFWRCRDCGKIYWPGSHWEKIEETVDRYERLRG